MKKRTLSVLLILIAGILLCVPKIIDVLFSHYSCEFLSLKQLEASDILGYVAEVIGGFFAMVAIIVAVQQFREEKTPLFIPSRLQVYFYKQGSGYFSIDSSLKGSEAIRAKEAAPYPFFEVENITENPAYNVDLEIDYQDGALYENLRTNTLGISTKPKITCYDTTKLLSLGVSSSKMKYRFEVPYVLRHMVQQLCSDMNNKTVSNEDLIAMQDALYDKRHKLAKLIISVTDIRKSRKIHVYDIYVQIDEDTSIEADFNVVFSFQVPK